MTSSKHWYGSVLRNAVKFAQLKSPKSFSQKWFFCVCLNVGMLALSKKRNATLIKLFFSLSALLFIMKFVESQWHRIILRKRHLRHSVPCKFLSSFHNSFSSLTLFIICLSFSFSLSNAFYFSSWAAEMLHSIWLVPCERSRGSANRSRPFLNPSSSYASCEGKCRQPFNCMMSARGNLRARWPYLGENLTDRCAKIRRDECARHPWRDVLLTARECACDEHRCPKIHPQGHTSSHALPRFILMWLRQNAKPNFLIAKGHCTDHSVNRLACPR